MKTRKMRRFAAAIAAFCMCAVAMAPVASMAASITIESETTAVNVSGKTFNIYKVFDVQTVVNDNDTPETSDDEVIGYKYIVADEWKSYFAGLVEVDEDTDKNDQAFINKISDYMTAIASDSPAAREFALQLKGQLTGKTPVNQEGLTITGDDTQVKFDNLDKGYYLIVDATADTSGEVDNGDAISAVMLTTAADTATITLKTDAPTIEKKIVEDSSLVDVNTAGIGEDVTYQISSTVPDLTHYYDYTFTMTDTLSSGLTYNSAVTPVVKLGNKILTVDEDYTFTHSDGVITIDFLKFVDWNDADDSGDYSDGDTVAKYTEGTAITVTYNATLNADAVIKGAGNPNVVDLTYSNDPDSTGYGNPGDTTKTPQDKVVTYVTDLQIKKTDDNGNILTGAEFTLEGNGYQYYLTVAADGTVKVSKSALTGMISALDKGEEEESTDDDTYKITAEVASDGTITFVGLGEGGYTITETTPPEGYNAITQPITVNITCGLPTGDPVDDDQYATWTYDVIGAVTATGTITPTDETPNPVYSIQVKNSMGTIFPSTGGMGTTLFTFGGLTLMAAAGTLYIVKRRAANK